MDTTPQVIPAPARREFSLGFKLVVFSAFCALVGQPVHFIDAENFDLYFGLWFFTLLFGLIGISVWHAFTRRLPMPKWLRGSHGVPLDTKSAESPRCSQCNYDLRSLTTDRCPECGWPTDRQRTELWWSHRKETGRWNAYWRTVRTCTFRPAWLATQALRPADQRDADRFATITALIAGLPLALTYLALLWSEGFGILNYLGGIHYWYGWRIEPIPDGLGLYLPHIIGLATIPVGAIGIMLGFWMIARASAGWFLRGDAPLEQKQRAATLSRYAMAPLAWTPLPLALFIFASVRAAFSMAARSRSTSGLWIPLMTAAGVLFGLLLLMCWINTLVLLWRAVAPTQNRLLLVAVALPIVWATCLAIGVAVLPWLAGYFWIIFDSLRS